MRNWTIKEAVEVINANQDQEAIAEIAKHFPQFFMAVAKNDIVALTQAMNEKFTVRRLQFGAVPDTDNDEDTDDEAPKAANKTSNKAVEADDTDLENMTTKQLMQLCDKRGIKVPHYGKNKQFYLEQLQGAGDASDAEEDTEDTEDTESENPYEGKTAMELYKMCKSRKIQAEQKKPAKYYIGLLTKADEAEAEADSDAEDEGWGDEEEAPAKEEKKPANNKASAGNGKASKAKKEEPAEDSDDDEWDI